MRKYKATLNTKSIDNLIKELTNYKDSFDSKMEEFVNRLIDVGIKTAENVPGISGSFGTHKFENFVWYYKEFEKSVDGCIGIMVGQGQTFDVTWGKDDEKSGSINALMALEFGTAGKALPRQEKFGVVGGQGTNSYYGHEDDDVWYFADGKDENGRLIWKKATAITPTRPMVQASDAMVREIKKIAREVFGK